MKQEEINEEKEWKDDEEPQTNVIKLAVGETIEALLVDIEDFVSSDGKTSKVYIIKIVDDENEKRLYGTTVLNQWMANKQIGDEFRLERLDDKPTGKGSPLQMYKTQSLK